MGMVVLLGGWALVRAGARVYGAAGWGTARRWRRRRARLPRLPRHRAGVRRPGGVGGEGRRDHGAGTAAGPGGPRALRLAAVVGGLPWAAAPDAGHLPGDLGSGAGPSGRPAPPS